MTAEVTNSDLEDLIRLAINATPNVGEHFRSNGHPDCDAYISKADPRTVTTIVAELRQLRIDTAIQREEIGRLQLTVEMLEQSTLEAAV